MPRPGREPSAHRAIDVINPGLHLEAGDLCHGLEVVPDRIEIDANYVIRHACRSAYRNLDLDK
jgi:hypothetical protein